MLILSLTTFLYLIYLQPYKTKLMNTMEPINELSVVFLGYILILYSDINTDPVFKYNLGFVSIILVLTCFVVNVAVIFTLTMKQFCKKLSKKCKKKQLIMPVSSTTMSTLIEESKIELPFEIVPSASLII